MGMAESREMPGRKKMMLIDWTTLGSYAEKVSMILASPQPPPALFQWV